MSRRVKWLPDRRWLFLPPMLVGLLVVGVLANSKKQLPKNDPVGEEALPVEVIALSETSIRPTAVGYGTARPKNIWTAVAEVGGRAIAIHPMLRSGNQIGEGEVLLQIDRTDYQLRIQQREADLSQARAQLEQLIQGKRSDQASLKLQRSLLDVQAAEMNRLRQLRGNAAASQSESDSAQAAYLRQALAVESLERTIALTPAQIASAEAAIKLAQARLDEAKRDLDRTTLRAPFEGLLSDVDLQPQQYVAPGTNLFELHETKTIEVEAQFSLAQMSRLVKLGGNHVPENETHPTDRVRITPAKLLAKLSATVTVRSGDVAVSFVGRPIRTSGTIDQQTRTLGIIVEVDSTGQLDQRRDVALRSGAYCEVVLSRTEDQPAIVIPRTAVRDQTVYVVDDEDRLQRREIRIQGTFGQNLIVEGLSAGERLVAKPPLDAASGLLVAPATLASVVRREVGDDTPVRVVRP